MIEGKILLLENNRTLRRGISALIESESGLEVCLKTDSNSKALTGIGAMHPHVVIVDTSPDEQTCLKTVYRITNECPDVAVVVLASSSGPRDVGRALTA